MSKLQELIQKLCPDEVEFKKLGDVCNFINGFAFKSSLFKEKGEIIIRITNINGTSIELDDVKYFNLSDYNTDLQSFIVSNGDILIAMSGATTGKVGCYYYKNKAYLNQRVGKFVPNKEKLNNRYLFHFLCSITTELYIMAGGGAQPNLSSTKLMNNVVIPLPPLDVQNEIVRILDTFTSHTAELQAELQARKEQYEYYRNKLLTFDKDDKNVKWMKLGDVCTLNRGIRVVRNDLNKNGKYPVYQNSLTPLGYYDKSNYPSNTTFIISAGAAGEIGFSKEPMWAADDCLCIICMDDLVSKYVYHYLIEHKIFLISKIRKASIPRLSRVTIEQLPIAIPNISEQQRIVSILDKFEALVNDLTEGLPAEIAAVQEQYEYYRNKLLTFKQK